MQGAQPGLGPALTRAEVSCTDKAELSHSLEVGLSRPEGSVHPDGRLTATRSPARDARAREALDGSQALPPGLPSTSPQETLLEAT